MGTYPLFQNESEAQFTLKNHSSKIQEIETYKIWLADFFSAKTVLILPNNWYITEQILQVFALKFHSFHMLEPSHLKLSPREGRSTLVLRRFMCSYFFSAESLGKLISPLFPHSLLGLPTCEESKDQLLNIANK